MYERCVSFCSLSPSLFFGSLPGAELLCFEAEAAAAAAEASGFYLSAIQVCSPALLRPVHSGPRRRREFLIDANLSPPPPLHRLPSLILAS